MNERVVQLTERATRLLSEWELCKRVSPNSEAISLQLEKDACEVVACQMHQEFFSLDPARLGDICDRFEHKLRGLEKRMVVEVLAHGVAGKRVHK